MPAVVYDFEALDAMKVVAQVINEYKRAHVTLMQFESFCSAFMAIGTFQVNLMKKARKIDNAIETIQCCGVGAFANHAMTHWLQWEYWKFKKGLKQRWTPKDLKQYATAHLHSFTERFLGENAKVYESMRMVDKKATDFLQESGFIPRAGDSLEQIEVKLGAWNELPKCGHGGCTSC
ncbi:hypothetical protein DM02DRAFT_651155 [Periconia macrospinosa]|uniref:Uncharacterized protein n=1 Tax=Periconia macrospinosa TaxID=97972 RepID=A0A2V1E3T8_9PLEO|nr:hypothetical protein DM02DRAFT_651155 [Periconia macrospinosa]